MQNDRPDLENSENASNPGTTSTRTRRATTIFVVLALIFLFFVLRSVLTAFIMACVLATLTWPLRDRLLKLTKNRPNLTSGILILGIIFLVGVPFAGITTLAVIQAQDLFANFNPQQVRTWILFQGDRLDQLPLASQLGLTSANLLQKLQEGMSDIATLGMNAAVGVGSNILQTLVVLGIMLMSLFYLYVSGESFVIRAKKLLPLAESQVADLIEVFRRTSRAILKGNFVIGAIQGTMTGLLFWGAGLPSPIFFGVLSAFASLIPAVGSGLVWGPAVLFLALSGDFTRAIVVLGIGLGLIASVDNILRPSLVGRDAGMHDLMVFLTTIGGLSYFGPIGVLFGPLVGAGTLAFVRLYEQSHSKSE